MLSPEPEALLRLGLVDFIFLLWFMACVGLAQKSMKAPFSDDFKAFWKVRFRASVGELVSFLSASSIANPKP